MVARMTNEDFKTRVTELFEGKYDLSDVQFENRKSMITLVCPEHGKFVKSAEALLLGRGCPVCSKIKMKEKLAQKKNSPEWKADYARRAAKRKQTFLDKYGVENPMQMDSTKEKIKQTCLDRYGVENPRQSQEVIDKARQTNLERYGAISYAKSEEGLSRIQDTMEARYGSRNFMQSEAVKDVLPDKLQKAKQTQMERYGAEHYAKSVDFRQNLRDRKEKEIQTKKQNGTLNSSVGEQELEQLLIARFGRDDVKSEYNQDSRYPFYCDFYIPSRDLFIELNACWTHGGHWYTGDGADKQMVDSWLSKKVPYYDNAADNWSRRDLVKREYARKHNLNYVVFWLTDIQDALLWFAMDCPDGQDWKREYSWLPERMLSFDGRFSKRQPFGNHAMLIKKYQFDVFYYKELFLWNVNAFYKHGIRLQPWLYINRYKYLNKLPHELTCLEILRGLRIAGVVKGFTVFSDTAMEEILQKYQIQRVLDVCAGWGERLLCCMEHDIVYTGIDVNQALKPGYDRMIADLGLTKQNILFGDAVSVHVTGQYDAVITCPPYWNQELYSSDGAENLSYEEFLDWWKQVVTKCRSLGVRYFCFQINQKYKEDMCRIVSECGFSELEQIDLYQQVSHFHRGNGTIRKKEYETMCVFEKI